MASLPNRTRTSPSIPRRLLREGKVHLIPVYALMRTSDLGREGIDHSGSYRFADHVYRNQPSGRYVVGRILDRLLLGLPGSRSMRNRYLHARREIVAAARRAEATGAELRVLSVPCGIARELVEASRMLRTEAPGVCGRATFFGLDLDPGPLALSGQLVGDDPRFSFIVGDALRPDAYPTNLDIIVSTGLGEFLDDAALARLYAACHRALRPGGVFVTSGMQPDRLADYLMRELAELRPRYRRGDELARALLGAGFAEVDARQDDVGLQTLIVARKHEGTAR